MTRRSAQFPDTSKKDFRRILILLAALPLCIAGPAQAQQEDAARILIPVALTCLAQDPNYARLPLGRALSERVQASQPGVLSAFASCLKGRKLFSNDLCTELLGQNPQAAPNAEPLLKKYGDEMQRVEELRACPPADPPK
jgi:hypothetical protein